MHKPAGIWRSHLLKTSFFIVLLFHILPFATRPALIGGDEPHYAIMAHSIAVDHDVALVDDYQEVAGGAKWAGKKRSGKTLDQHLLSLEGKVVFAHPLGLPLLAAPFLALWTAIIPGSAPDLVLGLLTLAVTFAALICGIQLSEAYACDARLGAAVVLATYFATPLWFYSRIFMPEPFIWSWAVLGLASQHSGRSGLASLFFALCLAMKETAALIVGPILIGYLVVLGLRRVFPLFIWPTVFVLLFVAKNLLLGVSAFSTFQPYRFSDGEGLLGFLVDPQRGLVWFGPLVVVGMAGWRKATRRDGSRVPLLIGSTILVMYYLVAAFWIDWRGGSSYGPRLLVPALPVVVLPLVALVRSHSQPLLKVLLLGGFAAGFSVNLCAALDPVHAFWSISAWQLLGDNPIGAVAGVLIAIGAGLVFLREPLGGKVDRSGRSSS